MKEAIGSKGGSNDRRRTVIITRNRKKKLKEKSENIKKIKELEKRVRRKQIINFFTAVPLVISGKVFKTIISNCTIINKTKDKKDSLNTLSNITIKKDNYINKEKETPDINEKKSDKLPIIIKTVEPKVYIVEENKKTEEPISKDIDKKIIETFEDKFKKVRTELKKIAYSNNIVNKDNIEYKKEAEDLLYKLDLVIKKLDECNNMIEKSKLGDEEYYYYLALKYIDEFNNHCIVANIKDSDLYIEIADKLKLLDLKKVELKDKLSDKQINNDILVDDSNIENMDDSFYDEFNENIEEIQNIQEEISEEFSDSIKEEKINSKAKKEEKNIHNKKEYNKVNKSNNVEVIEDNKNKVIDEASAALIKAKALNRYCEKLLSIINKPSMKLPSVRSTKAVAVTTLIAAYFMKKILRNKYIIKRRKKILAKDYDKYIENDLENINKVSDLIKQASSKISDIINEIIKRYSDYLYLKEFQELLDNLENIKNNILEKEYEIDNIRKDRQNSLNNQKIKN